ncbi:MAG: DNA starvation/stationary phase protection protein Dps [Gemmataceae bacterium]
MHRTKNDLPKDRRVELVKLLNDRLADVVDLHLQAKQAHWNVRGPNFIALHELFDKVAEEAEEHADLIAERAAALGGPSDGTAQVVVKKTTLSPYPLNIASGHDHVEALSSALAAFGKQAREAIDKATQLGDADTADLFTEVSRETDKNLWFVEAHLQAER